MPYTYDYPRPALTVDAVIAVPLPSGDRYDGDEASFEVLLIERGREPFLGCWALPGGFVEIDEEIEDALARELEEETGVSDLAAEFLGVFGRIGRDPRGRTVSVAFLAVLDERPRARAGDDAAKVGWFPLDRPPELAFDHDEILARAREALKGRNPGL